jgi:hypothetical protein
MDIYIIGTIIVILAVLGYVAWCVYVYAFDFTLINNLLQGPTRIREEQERTNQLLEEIRRELAKKK